MYSDSAPNRNPAEISYTAVDRRLTVIQRDEILDIAKHYNATSYYCEFGNDTTKQRAASVCVIGEYDDTLCYVDRAGKVYPNWS